MDDLPVSQSLSSGVRAQAYRARRSESPQDVGEIRRERLTWFVLAMLVIAGHWAGGTLFHAADDAWREWHVPTAWFLLPTALIGGVLWTLFVLRLGNRSRITRRHGKALLLAAATTLVSFGAATCAERTLVALANGWAITSRDFWGGALYWIVFVWLVVRLFKHRKELGAVIKFPKQKSSPARKHLILFLSHLVGVEDKEKRPLFTNGVPNWFVKDKESRESSAKAMDIQTDLLRLLELKKENPTQRWTWEMPLRAIQHHRPILRQVTVICSPQSLVQAPWFLDIAAVCFPEVTFALWAERKNTQRLERIEAPEAKAAIGELQGRDFEELDVLSGSVRDLLDTLTESEQLSDRDIAIDFTGGQKTTSIVAAGITFNRQINAQYVRTDGRFERPGEDIISFELTVDPVGAGPG